MNLLKKNLVSCKGMDTAEFRKPRPDFPIVPQSAIYRQGELVPFKVPKGRRGKKPKGKRGIPRQGKVPLPIRKPPKQRKLEEAKIQQIKDNIKFQRETLQLQKDIAQETIRYRTRKQDREREQQAVRQIENRLVQRRHDRLIEEQAQVFQTLLDRQQQDTQSQFERAERREGRLQQDYQTFMREVLQSRGLPQEEEEIDIRFFQDPVEEGGFSSAMGQELGRPDESMGARLRRQQQQEQQVPLTPAEQQEVRFKIYQGITQPSPTSAEARQLRTLETAQQLLEDSPLSPRREKSPAEILLERQREDQQRLQQVQRQDEAERRERRERFEQTAEQAGLRLSPVAGADLRPPETPPLAPTYRVYRRSGEGTEDAPPEGFTLGEGQPQPRARELLLRRGGSARATQQLQAQLSEPIPTGVIDPDRAIISPTTGIRELREGEQSPPTEEEGLTYEQALARFGTVGEGGQRIPPPTAPPPRGSTTPPDPFQETLAHAEDVAFEQQIEPALAEQRTEPLAGQEEEISPATDVFIPTPTAEQRRRLQGQGLVEEAFDEPQPEPAPKRLPTPSPRPPPRPQPTPQPEPEPAPAPTEAQQFFEQQVKTEPRKARFSGIRPELLQKAGHRDDPLTPAQEETEARLYELLDQQFTKADNPKLRQDIYKASRKHLKALGVVKTNVKNYQALTELLTDRPRKLPTGKGALFLEIQEPLLRTSKATVEKFPGIYKVRQLPAKGQGTGFVLQNVLGEGEAGQAGGDIGQLNIFKKGTKATGGINPFQKALDEGKVIIHQRK